MFSVHCPRQPLKSWGNDMDRSQNFQNRKLSPFIDNCHEYMARPAIYHTFHTSPVKRKTKTKTMKAFIKNALYLVGRNTLNSFCEVAHTLRYHCSAFTLHIDFVRWKLRFDWILGTYEEICEQNMVSTCLG